MKRSHASVFALWFLLSIQLSRLLGTSDASEAIAGRSDWDHAINVGLTGKHSSLWKGFDQFGKAVAAGLSEFVATLTQTQQGDLLLTLLDGETLSLRQIQVDRIDTSIRFAIESSSANAFQGGANVVRGTEFALHLAPFAGYEETSSMLRLALRIQRPIRVSEMEDTHNSNYLEYIISSMADAIRIQIGAFPCSTDFRSLSGTCNNPDFPDWGSAGTYLRRLESSPGSSASAKDPSYLPGTTSEPRKNMPNARFISRTIFGAAVPRANTRKVSVELVWWGQWLDHDLDFSPGSSGTVFEEKIDIPLSPDDPMSEALNASSISFGRSLASKRTASPYTSRAQLNEQTSFVDASQVYGCHRDRTKALRTLKGGLLKVDNNMLPKNSIPAIGVKLKNEMTQDDDQYVAGDARVNEQPLLAAHHTLFVREHNRIATKLSQMFPCFKDEQSFQYARKIVSAQIQYITYEHYIPALLGEGALPAYKGFDKSVDPSIQNFFSTVAFRFGHSQVPNNFKVLLSKDQAHSEDNMPLKKTFFDPAFLNRVGIEPLLLGATHQLAEAVDTVVVDALRNSLFEKHTGGMDLVAMNIQRARDHGIPLYCDARELYGLNRPTKWSDLTSDRALQALLQKVYNSVCEVEAFVGCLAEDRVPGTEVGSLLLAALVQQFTKLRDGDRFFYKTLEFPGALAELAEVREIREKTMKLQHIFVRNAVPKSKISLDDFAPNIFFTQ